MRSRSTYFLAATALSAVIGIGVLYAQRPFRVYPGVEHVEDPLPSDYQEKSEWVFARLMYPPIAGGGYYSYSTLR